MKHYDTPKSWHGGRTPDGDTNDFSTYVDSWDKFIKQTEEITGLKCYGYDPDVALCLNDGKMSQTTSMPVWLIKRILKNTGTSRKHKTKQML